MNNKNKYYNLESNIISCILIKPELIKEMKLEKKHFKSFYNLFVFIRSFYEKFGVIDICLMNNVCKDNFKFINYIEELILLEQNANNFYLYQDRLIEMYEQDKKEEWKIDKIYQLANDLVVRKIDTKEFGLKVNEIYKNANEIFKKEDD